MKKTGRIVSVVLALVLILSAVCALAACNKKTDESLVSKYSYRMGPSDLPTAWNVHTYQSNSATYVLDYSSDTLYTFDYKDINNPSAGYAIVPSMAASDPVDVTSEYASRFGYSETENKAYKITLKQTLKFDNGDPINARTFEESMKLLLAPEAVNFRADNVYASGDLKILGAENYVKQGSYSYGEFVSENYGAEEYVDPTDFVANAEGILQYEGRDAALNIYDGGNWGSNGLADYAGLGYLSTGYVMDDTTDRAKVFDVDGKWILTRSLEEDEEAKDYLFYDLEGNLLKQRYVNDAGTAWVYLDKDGNIVEEWAGCKIKYVSPSYDPLEAAADKDGYVKLTAALLKNLQDCIATLHGCANVEEYAAKCEDDDNFVGADGDINYAYVEWEEMALWGKYYEVFDWSGVGFFAASDYDLIIVLKNPMEDNFYLRYELCSSFFLVHPETYKACIDTSKGSYTNSYGTSVDTYVGFGPYKLTSYVADNSMRLERNEYWHGYSEAGAEGKYQTTDIVYTVVKDDATRLEMFLKGELDSYGLQAKDMKDYINSDYLYYTDSESTWYLAMNPQLENLEKVQKEASPVTAGNKVIKTILSIQEFRQAMSYSLDREAFNLVLSPTSGVAKALLSSMIVADPDSGSSYRETEAAKDAILSFWGLADQWGEGKKYATRDDAIASITGYDPTGAKALFDAAYDKAVADGLFEEAGINPETDKWELQILIGMPSKSATFYTEGSQYLQTNWTNAVKGTKFEGHLSFVESQELGSSSFGEYLRNGSVDLLFGVGYGGSMFNPYSMMDCFTGNLQYDKFTDKAKVDLDIEIGGKTLRASLYAWVSQCLQGDKITATVIGADGNATSETVSISAGASDDPATRIKILAVCEEKVLSLSNIIPLMTDSSASLRCMRIVYKTEEYILGLGRGGVEYYTYTMDDATWANYVKEQGGTLNYK